MNRKQIAEQFHVSPRMLADAVFILNHAPEGIIEQVTQRDRIALELTTKARLKVTS